MQTPGALEPVVLTALSKSLRDRLWSLAQHTYGWGYAHGWRQLRAYRALERRGLVQVADGRCDTGVWAFALTQEGARQAQRRWPLSPFALGTYDRPPEGWDLRDAPLRLADGHTPYIPGVPCVDCGRFVGSDGAYSYETPDMTLDQVGLEGTCGRCLHDIRAAESALAAA